MIFVRRCALSVLSVVTVGLLSGCATPHAGPNAGADAAATTAPAPSPPAAAKPSVGQEVAAVADNQVTVLFPRDGATLTPQADHQLDLAARLFRDAHPVAMFTTGYSDGSGDEYANLILSAKRAEAVKRGLVARGIPPDRLLIQALGESELADRSQPDAADNRRVVITWRLL